MVIACRSEPPPGSVNAIVARSRPVAIDGRQYDALYNIGLVAADAGRRQQAVKALARFVDTAPAGRFGTEIARARALLERLKG